MRTTFFLITILLFSPIWLCSFLVRFAWSLLRFGWNAAEWFTLWMRGDSPTKKPSSPYRERYNNKGEWI